MKKFLVLYKAKTSGFEQMKNATPEQQKAGMDMWMKWGKKAASSIVDMGAPLGKTLKVTKSGDASRVVERARRLLASSRRSRRKRSRRRSKATRTS